MKFEYKIIGLIFLKVQYHKKEHKKYLNLEKVSFYIRIQTKKQLSK